ncbi:MAG: hypothetical protein Q4B70_19480, partial [Lachnospiraceae bacterium]|nr:hypothetical protein [Lachnospiraceae bacterium]
YGKKVLEIIDARDKYDDILFVIRGLRCLAGIVPVIFFTCSLKEKNANFVLLHELQERTMLNI